jgi:heme exporter protein A
MRLSGCDLACVRGGREVFAGVNFAVDSGEALVVTGRNGAGKTTLLRLIAGLLEPAAGRVELAGGAPEASLPEQAHYLGHRDALKPALTVLENLRFWYAFLGGRDASIASALETVGLGGLENLPAGYLSAGQRRRLSIARLIAVPRPVWLLDEPTAALDSAGQQRLGGLMQAHLAGGGIIVAATHGPLGLEGTRELRLEPQASLLTPDRVTTFGPSPQDGGAAGGSGGGEQTSHPGGGTP